MKKNKLLALSMATVIALTSLNGCGKKNDVAEIDPVINVSAVPEMNSPEDMQVLYKDGYILSDLTGEWIDESLKNKRPLCIMINNIIDAMPQSGISKADITYEMLVEGGITRYLCVFRDYANVGKLGPVRSARPYYVEMTEMYDGFYGHVGWSTLAEEMITNSDLPDLNGLTALSTIMYFRDESRVAPHNCYTNGESAVAGIEYMGYSTEHDSTYDKDMFKFNYKDKDLGTGKVANKITTAYSESRKPWFEYNAEDKRYYRFQYGEKQIDDQTGEQLSYKNVIIQFVQYTQIDDYGLQLIDWNPGGQAIYCTNGEYENIIWKKDNGVVKYYHADGTQLSMNPGNTFVTVFDQLLPQNVTIE